MPILRDFERRLGGLVEGLFSKTFRSGVQPVEIAKPSSGRWTPEAASASRRSGRRTIRLLPLAEDAARFEQAEAALVSELKAVVRENAAERGWGLVGPPEVEFVSTTS